MRTLSRVSLILLGLTGLGACTDGRSNPLAATSAGTPSFNRNRDGDDRESDNENDGFLRLASVMGPGQGRLRATRVPHPTTPGNFAVHIELRIRHAKPSTAYLAQRAAEVFPAGVPTGFDATTLTDGSCQRGLAIAPWSTLTPTPAAFVSFPDQANGLPAVVFTTDGDGNGAADFVYAAANPLPLFDVTFRVIEKSPAPTSMLQTDCTVVPLI